MTELDFISTSPLDYGGNVNVNLLVSSSVVNPGVDNTPTGSLTVVGMTIPFQDDEGTSLNSALKEIDELRHEMMLLSQDKQKRAHKLLWDFIEHNIQNWWD